MDVNPDLAPRQVFAGEAAFPMELSGIPDPPVAVFLQGELPPPPRVAVVGARRSDPYGLECARKLASELTRAGVSVVSGGAAGIDTAALEGSLEAGGRPVAVLGTGLDVAYPTANAPLFQAVAERGLLLSEYPPGTPGRPYHFPRRNRLISALSQGVVVIRAALGSGSLITARLAEAQGRILMAVPGPIGLELSRGPHALLRRGAILVESAEDVLVAIGAVQPRPHASGLHPGGPHPGGPHPDARPEPVQCALPLPDPSEGPAAPCVPSVPSEPLDADERLIFEALGRDETPIDALIDHTGLPSGRIAALLLQLELKGLVTQRLGMRFRWAAPLARERR